AATGWAPDQGPQPGCLFDVGIFLEVTEGRGRFGPAVKAQDRGGEPGRVVQQRLIQRHVERGVAFAGIDIKPGIHFQPRIDTRRRAARYGEGRQINTDGTGNAIASLECASPLALSYTVSASKAPGDW